MTTNLIRAEWKSLDQGELRLLLDKRIGGPGQYDGRSGNPNALYLPLARSSCRIKLTFRDKKIIIVEPGPAFDAAEWERICEEIEKSILSGTCKVGREYSFSSFRVLGSWHGIRSGVQILVPPEDAPSAPVEIADHPFILEFPVKASDQDWVTNHRRIREHRRLTLLLNVLLRGHTRFQQRRVEHCWASVPEIKWVQPSFFARLGPLVTDAVSPTAGQRLEELEPGEYYTTVGNDGKGLRVPSDLDHSICLYFQLSPPNLTRFDRALFWMDVSSRQWTISISSSFASLVSAVEALTERGTTHEVYCERCKSKCQHEVPGAIERFRAFFEKYAPGAALRSRRSEMYALRSDILHGSDLMQLDQDLAFGWDPPEWNERELYNELWSLTRIALRNWLRNPGGNNEAGQRTPEPALHFWIGRHTIGSPKDCVFFGEIIETDSAAHRPRQVPPLSNRENGRGRRPWSGRRALQCLSWPVSGEPGMCPFPKSWRLCLDPGNPEVTEMAHT